MQLRVNDLAASQPAWDLMQYGKYNAIVHHGIHGLYKLWTVHVDPVRFNVGTNMMFLTQRKTIGGPLTGVMYDYLRLEALPPWKEILRFLNIVLRHWLRSPH